MEEFILNDRLSCSDVVSGEEIAHALSERNEAIFIMLEYIKAADWPWRGMPLNRNRFPLPLVWGVFDVTKEGNIRMVWDIHPMKCFPARYNRDNPNAHSSPMPISKSGQVVLGGCSRNFVTVSNRRYEVAEKTPAYCSIFGLPDDCYDPGFEARMVDRLKSYRQQSVWCFERTPYVQERIEPHSTLLYMKGEFLPSKNFLYVEGSERFLTAIFTARQLQSMTSELWYSSGRELIEDMSLESPDGFRFEEKANYYIRKRLIQEFVRLSLLLAKREEFSLFQPASLFVPKSIAKCEVETALASIVRRTKVEGERHAANLLNRVKSQIDIAQLRTHRFVVADVEYIHVPYPTAERNGSFNFPCIFSNLVWRGAKGLEINTNVFLVPCHFCSRRCSASKQSALDFGCLPCGFEFIESQNRLLEEALTTHEGFKVYTYGSSDAFQLEQANNFFSDSFERRRYERRNRKVARRITEISEDLSAASTSLHEIEDGMLSDWLVCQPRSQPKVSVNNRFMTRYGTANWARSYSEAIASCVGDATSAFLYLLHKKYRRSSA